MTPRQTRTLDADCLDEVDAFHSHVFNWREPPGATCLQDLRKQSGGEKGKRLRAMSTLFFFLFLLPISLVLGHSHLTDQTSRRQRMGEPMNWRNRKLVSEIKTGNNDQLVLRLIQSVRKAMVTAFLEKNDSHNYPKNLSAILYFTEHIGQYQFKHLRQKNSHWK